LIVMASLCMIFQIVEISLNAAQVQRDGRTAALVVGSTCPKIVLLWIGSCLAISADAFVFYNQRTIKAIMVLVYNLLVAYNIYQYLFRWHTEGSPAVCILHPWYFNRLS
jgi:hypothetical protein